MLPLIVIGADERTDKALTQVLNAAGLPSPFGCLRQHFDDTEQAVYGLNDALKFERERPGRLLSRIEFDGNRNAWRANVAYGPRVLGLAATGQPVRLPHTGWTLVLAWDLGDPAAPRRVVEGRPEGEDQSTIAWQAAPILAANLVIDLAMPAINGTPFPGLVAVLNTMRERVEP